MAAFLRRLAEGQIVDAGSLGGRSAAEFPTQAYALVDDDGTVETDDSFNPAGEITVNRNESSVGFYDVTFTGFDINHAQVTRYGNDSSGDSCSIRDWVGGSTVRVRCFDNSGAGVFSEFAVSVISHG